MSYQRCGGPPVTLSGLGGVLAAVYANGGSAADQTAVLLNTKGGGIILDGSGTLTGAALTIKAPLPLSFSDASSGGAAKFWYDQTFYHPYELLLSVSKDHSNVLAIQNTSTGTNPFSCMIFRANDGIERGSIGYGNATCNAPFTSCTFLEASYYTGSAHTTPPVPFRIIQTGYVGGVYGSYLRMEFGSDGTIHSYLPDGATMVWQQLASGWTKFTGSVAGDNVFTLRNSDATGYSGLQLNDSTDTKAGVLGFGNSGAASWCLGCVYLSGSSHPVLLSIGGSEKLRVHSDGRIGVQMATPTAWMHIKAGAAAASSAPLKIDAGTLLSTPEVGAIEFDGTHFYGTVNGGTRKQLDN